MKKIIYLSQVLFFGIISICVEAQTTITLQPGAKEGKDASLFSKDEGLNHGDRNGITAYTWTNNGEHCNKRAFFSFDLSSIPENATITNANLSLFYNPTDPIESWDEHYGENETYIQRIISDWDEHTITWNSQPNTTTVNAVKLPRSTGPRQDYLNIDVTNLVIDMTDPLAENYGFMFRMVDEINYYKGVLFASSDHLDAALHPKLIVTFEIDTSNILIATAAAGVDTTSCYNNAFTLSGTAVNGTISWSTSGDGTFSGGTTATPTYIFGTDDIASGQVVLTITVTGEANTATDNMVVTIDPKATADAGADAIAQHDKPYILSGHAFYGAISWSTSGNGTFNGGTTITPIYTIGDKDIADGNVILTITVEGNCNTATDEMLLEIYSEEETPPFDFKLYPNPTIQYLTIELNRDIELSLELFNTLGQLILEIPNIGRKETLDISILSGGTYTIRLVNNDIVAIKKLVVK